MHSYMLNRLARGPVFFIQFMMTSLSGNIFRVTGHLCGEFTGPRWIPRTKASDEELWCFLWSASQLTVLSKQSWGWWFVTLSSPLWRHCNVWPWWRHDVDSLSELLPIYEGPLGHYRFVYRQMSPRNKDWVLIVVILFLSWATAKISEMWC